MKVGEMEFNGRDEDFLGLGSALALFRGSPVRVEIHSLDDEWSTERPKGWGPGWWFRVNDQICICTRFERLGSTGSIIWVTGIRLTPPVVDVSIPGRNITAYGPRVEFRVSERRGRDEDYIFGELPSAKRGV